MVGKEGQLLSARRVLRAPQGYGLVLGLGGQVGKWKGRGT